jgi:hypothetical protein
MHMKHLLPALLALAIPLQAQAASEWRFTAYLDDKPIGYHRFALSEENGERRLVSEARFDVKFLFVSAYRYAHDNREHWRGDCLARIEAVTDANGKNYRVRGRLTHDEFEVDTGREQTALPACVMSFAYWNPQFLQQPRLLNAQNGEYLDVSVRDLGADTITVRGTEQPARRYRLEAKGFQIELWYSPQREWLALDSITESGKRLRYRLE